MTTSEMFQEFLENLKITNSEQISNRYGEITAALNKKFRDTESKTANTLQVGSYGRWTGINGISDLDMLYIMPKTKWDDYKEGKQEKLLSDTRQAIKDRYPSTTVKVSGLVVQVQYQNFQVEVQPVFEQDDGSFKYPHTRNGGEWKITKPKDEIAAMKEFVDQKNKNLRRLCKMARAWKNKSGVVMGGLLIDTLSHNFLKSTDQYDSKSYGSYDQLAKDFFEYLENEPEKEFYAALGSGQRVNVKKKFQGKAKKARKLCQEAIDAESSELASEKWRQIFGRNFPLVEEESKDEALSKSLFGWRNTEEFIEDKFPIDIQYELRIECEVSQNGFRENLLRKMLANRIPLLANKKLLFQVMETNTPEPYFVYWKVLNRGAEAKRRDCIRGQIISDDGFEKRKESTNFRGAHLVECYIVQYAVVVARDAIDVPIQ